MSKNLNETIGKRIRTYREGLGMSREAFSEKVGLSPQFLAEVENGKKGLSAESIYKICTNSELSADYLVLGEWQKEKVKGPLTYVLQDMPGEYSTQYVRLLRAVNELAAEAQKNGALLKDKFDE